MDPRFNFGTSACCLGCARPPCRQGHGAGKALSGRPPTDNYVEETEQDSRGAIQQPEEHHNLVADAGAAAASALDCNNKDPADTVG